MLGGGKVIRVYFDGRAKAFGTNVRLDDVVIYGRDYSGDPAGIAAPICRGRPGCNSPEVGRLSVEDARRRCPTFSSHP